MTETQQSLPKKTTVDVSNYTISLKYNLFATLDVPGVKDIHFDSTENTAQQELFTDQCLTRRRFVA